MHPQIYLWLRETGKLSVRYWIACMAFVPAGLVYAELQRAGRGTMFAMFACLLLGLPFAFLLWRWSGRTDVRVGIKPPAALQLSAGPVSAGLGRAMLANPQNWALADASLAMMREHARQLVDMRGKKPVNRQQFESLPVHAAFSQDDATLTSERMGATHAAFSGASS